MKTDCVVSNSSPIMNLAIIGQLDLLRQIFGVILVPDEVWDELTVAGRGKPGTEHIIRTTWIQVIALHNRALMISLEKDLDRGEAASIALAVERQADWVLLDEVDARNMADLYQLRKTGVIGILTRAKRLQLIQTIKPFLDLLKTQANFRIHPHLYQKVLTQAGE